MLLLKLEASVLMSATTRGVLDTTERRVKAILEVHLQNVKENNTKISAGVEQNPMAERL